MYRLFESFLNTMKAGFRRIVKAARNDMTVEDLHSDAWILAHEIGEKRGKALDFADPEDQELVMRALNARNVKWGDWKMRRAVRIDLEPDDDDKAFCWRDRLAADAASDPLVSLLLRETASSAEAMLASSYSQAAAYVMVFSRFRNNRREVCAYLVISDGTLSRRVAFAADTVRVQPSLFDRIERIDEAFMPPPGRQYAARIERHREAEQWGWDFEEWPLASVRMS